MSTPEFEAFLARLYTSAEARERFLRDRRGEARAAGLTAEQSEALMGLDAEGLEAAAASFGRKREQKERHGKRRWFGLRLH